MSKTQETKIIERALELYMKEKRMYGCEEVTIGFPNQGLGDEIVDYIMMDSKGAIRCYEIKVTKKDLLSHNKKSFYGNYNYLVIGQSLYESTMQKGDFTFLCYKANIPDEAGVIVVGEAKEPYKLKTLKKAKRIDIQKENELMLKESMVRSISYKLQNAKDANNIETKKNLEKNIRLLKKELEKTNKRYGYSDYILNQLEIYASRAEKRDVTLVELLKREQDKFINTLPDDKKEFWRNKTETDLRLAESMEKL